MLSALLPVLGSVVGGVMQSRAASRAADAQQRAADQQVALARETRDLTRADLQPWRQTGGLANNALASAMGLTPSADPYGGYQRSPGYQFQMDQGLSALEGTAAARGGLFSGRAGRAAMDYGQGLAAQDFQNYLGNLFNMSGMGQSAAAGQATAAQNYGQMAGNAIGDRANAQSAGYIGQANAFSDAMQNALGAWNYQNMMRSTPSATDPATRGIFGGLPW